MKIYVIDLFAGAGGTTTGIHRARMDGRQIAWVIYCINHNPNALASHKLNHIRCKHIIEDVKLVNLATLLQEVIRIRNEEPDALIGLWGSPDCTGHSKAKANKKKNRDLRSLANSMIRYAKVLKPDFIQVENVPEFIQWGPCDKNDVPIKKLKGTLYFKWKRRIEAIGYRYDHRFLCAADYGGYTTRTRYFGLFVKEGLPIVFPQATHTKNPKPSLFDQLKPWKPVREVLDLDIEGLSIFKNPRIRSDKTFRRIYRGCQKYVPNQEDRFMVKYQGTSTTADLDMPAPTLTKKDRLALVKLDFINNHYGGSDFTKTNNPLGAITRNPKQELLSVEKQHFLYNPQFDSRGRSIDEPCFTLIARMDKAPPELITAIMGRNDELKSLLAKSSGYKAKLIRFMLDNRILDIKKRMLSIPELLRIQGFGNHYKLTGTKTEQKEFIGNSVHPIIPQRWFEAIASRLNIVSKQVA